MGLTPEQEFVFCMVISAIILGLILIHHLWSKNRDNQPRFRDNLMFGSTWRCHICGDERPDHLISVVTKPVTLVSGVETVQNIRYCNDRPKCLEGTKDFSFFKGDDNENNGSEHT